jgi:hypothetical protein
MKELQTQDQLSNEYEYLMERWTFPRLAGSDGSFKIVQLLKEDFSTFNLEFTQHDFPVFKSNKSFKLSKFFKIFSFLSMIFLLSLMFLFWWTIPFSLIIVGYGVKNRHLFLKKNPCVRRQEKESDPDKKVAFNQSNLIYRLKAYRKKKYNVILMAHHDSKSQYLSTYLRAYVAFIFLVFIISAVLAYFTVLFFERRDILDLYAYGLKLYVFIIGWLAVSFFLTMASNYISNESPGALDNASGVYSIYKTAQYLHDTPFPHTEVWFVLTGAEEIDQEGAAAFLNKYRPQLNTENTLVINLDMIGLKDNPLEVVNSFYIPKKVLTPSMCDLVFNSAEALEIELRGWYLWIGGYTDGFLFHEEGYKTLNFITKYASKYTHQKNDTFNLVDPYLIEKQARLNVEIIQNLNQKLHLKDL